MTPRRRRVLFMAEGVTLAHIARPLALAEQLDSTRYEVHFACDPRSRSLLSGVECGYTPVDSISKERFRRALAAGSPVYDTATLRAYVRADQRVLETTAPDVVVGDFRLSLSVSAALVGVPYLNVTNAYWSPYARARFPVPELWLTRLIGRACAQPLFDLMRPLAFAYHAMPLNRVRKQYGMPSLGLDLRRVYTAGDWTLYADIPELVPTYTLPSNHRYLGPVLWSPKMELPDWWHRLPRGRPLIYVNLGSSGDERALSAVLGAVEGMPVTVVAATAGRARPSQVPANVWLADYLPGGRVASAAAVVVCNGGSPTALQALAAGAPILGIPSNLDQYANMRYMVQAGVGIQLPAGTLAAAEVRHALLRLLDVGRGYREQAAQAALWARSYKPATILDAVLDEALGG